MSRIHYIEDLLTASELEIFAQHISNTPKDGFPSLPPTINYESIRDRVKSLIEAEFSITVQEYDYPGLDYNISTIGEKQDVHIDFTKREERPDFSSTLYWVDSFDGGEIYFPDDKIEIKPKEGSLIFWRNPVFHGVKEITAGDRYASSFFWVKT
jgi:hypothetical protein